MKKFLTLAGLSLCLAASASLASAQEQSQSEAGRRGEQQQNPLGRRGGRKHDGRFGRRGHGMRALGRLNLTEAQQGQVRAIHDAARQRTQAQHEELRQLFQTRQGGGQLTAEQQARVEQLRSELRANHKSVNQEILRVLTAEQRAQLEQVKQERKSRRHEMRGRRKPMENEQQ